MQSDTVRQRVAVVENEAKYTDLYKLHPVLKLTDYWRKCCSTDLQAV